MSTVDGVYTNKAPGGVAYRCSFRVTEASYFIERMIDVLARKLEMDPAELRLKNFITAEQFPYTVGAGLGVRQRRLSTPPWSKALAAVELCKGLRAEQAANRAGVRPTARPASLMGVGVAFFTEIVGAGPT